MLSIASELPPLPRLSQASTIVKCTMRSPFGRHMVRFTAESCHGPGFIVVQRIQNPERSEGLSSGQLGATCRSNPSRCWKGSFAGSTRAGGHYHRVCRSRVGYRWGFPRSVQLLAAPWRDGQHYHDFKSAPCRPGKCSQLHRRCRPCRGCGHV